MKDVIHFTVFGIAVSQGSKRAFVSPNLKAPVLVDTNAAKLKPWRAEIASAAREAMDGQVAFDEPVRVDIQFYLPSPQKPQWSLPAVKPDGDKLERAIFDGITGVVVKDDARIVECYWAKRYGVSEPQVEITVQTLLEREPDDA